MANIKKIKLSNGQVYSIFDEGALRLNADKKLVTGNTIVDKVIIEGNVFITEIDDVPVTDSISRVLVMDPDTGEIKYRSTDYLLKDIGGISYNMDAPTGNLTLQIGKQSS